MIYFRVGGKPIRGRRRKKNLLCRTNNNKYTYRLASNHGRLPAKKAFAHQSWLPIAINTEKQTNTKA